MAYMVRTVQAGQVREVKKMHTVRANRPGATRAIAIHPTSARQEAINERRAEENLRWRLNANFGKRDYHLVLHYSDKSREFGQCLEDLKLFFRRLRRACRKAEIPLRYVAVTETKRMTNIHHHIVLNRMSMELIQDCWDNIAGSGGVSVRPLDDRGNHAKLARYLIKESKSTMARYAELGRRGKRFTCSQGLVIPKPEYRRIEASHWTEHPRPRKGAYLYKWDDGQTVRSGWDDRGMPWQEYFEIYAVDPRIRTRKIRGG